MTDEPRPPFDEPTAEELPALLEALLFVADGPVPEGALSRTLGVTPGKVRRALNEVREDLDGRGIRVQQGPEGVQFITAPEAAAAVEHFLGLESSRRLSTAALETLAVIAYRQPVTRGAIEAIRGTSSDGVLATLRARGLVERVGRAEGPGRPGLYATTQRFLEHFGLERADHLPGLDELAELLGLDDGVQQSLLDGTDPDEAPQGDAPSEAELSEAADPDPVVQPPLNL
ncbi:MAG: SMC-Scp complex subunit ScpB [Chloroflexota bacterium]|nr:SMC-Scp complex subunit ScpB [Chloroflexota bacterium]